MYLLELTKYYFQRLKTGKYNLNVVYEAKETVLHVR